VHLTPERIEPGDLILINGPVGNHEASILCARGDFSFDKKVESDCAPLSHLMQEVIREVPELKCARDPTRGGVASVLTEMVEHSGYAMTLEEQHIPVDEDVQGVCDILGMDPLMMANEGKMIVIAPEFRADACLEAMRRVPEGGGASVIGQVHQGQPRLTMKTPFGTTRVITMPMGNQLPRIC
jgi:hydrogenase expression/formation protein HypE